MPGEATTTSVVMRNSMLTGLFPRSGLTDEAAYQPACRRQAGSYGIAADPTE